MNKKTKTLLGIVIFAAFIALTVFLYNNLAENFAPKDAFEIAAGNATAAPQGTPGANGGTNAPTEDASAIIAPDFTVYDADGNEIKLSDYFGKPIIVNFWATWCGYCKQEMPYFNSIYEDVKDDIVFLMVDVVDGTRETQEKGMKYIADNGFTFPVVYDLDQSAVYEYGIRAFPTTIVINSDGTVFGGQEGMLSEESLLNVVQQLKDMM